MDPIQYFGTLFEFRTRTSAERPKGGAPAALDLGGLTVGLGGRRDDGEVLLVPGLWGGIQVEPGLQVHRGGFTCWIQRGRPDVV